MKSSFIWILMTYEFPHNVYQRNSLQPFPKQFVITDKTDLNLKLPTVVQVSFAVSGRPVYLRWVFWWYFRYVTFCSHNHLPMSSLSSQFQMCININTSYLLKQYAQLPHTTKKHPCSVKTQFYYSKDTQNYYYLWC